ncbi:MAG: transposase [Bdellovibrionales bacterium]
MPRKRIPPQSDFPLFIGAKFINGQWFDVPVDVAWEVLCNLFYFIHYGFEVNVHAFVLMSNHFHALVSTPRANLPAAMNFFMCESSRELGRRNGRINQIWGEPYYASVLPTTFAFQNAYKYTYRNPVAAGIVSRCEAYPYSTLRGLLGFERLDIPIQNDFVLFQSGVDWETLDWLNQAKEEDEAIVKKALGRKLYKYGKQKNGCPLRKEDFVY